MKGSLAQKTLAEGARLSLVAYELGPESARELRRPIGSHEIVLCSTQQGLYGGATRPIASWYVPKQDFRRLYDLIKTEEDFRRVNRLLDGVKSAEDTKKVSIFLDELLQAQSNPDPMNSPSL